MNTKTVPILLLLLTLAACAPAQGTPTAPLPFVTVTPTLFLGSPIPPLETPVPAGTVAPGLTPFPTFTPLTQPTQASPNESSATYAVIQVPENDVLNIRSGPGVQNAVVGTLEPAASGLTRTGKTMLVGEDLWVEIQNPGGGTGWVNSKFLTEQVAPATFCADSRVTALLNNLETAVNTTNGDLLKTLVSPAHGLDVIYVRNGIAANYSPEEAGWVFQSTYDVNWGLGAGSGEPVTGTFPEIVLPALQETFKNASTTCNEIKLGGATYEIHWPVEYANLNFYSIHNPGNDPANGGLDWSTWLAGVEYVNGQPYLTALLHYQWEP